MGALGRLALVPAATLTFLLALVPVLAVIVLGTLGFRLAAADPHVMAAAWHGARAAAPAAAAGWAAGVSGALGIWRGRVWWRRLVLAAAWMLLLPQALAVQGFSHLLPGSGVAPRAAAFIAQAAHAGGLVVLIMTSMLNRLDPQILRSAAASGAAPLQVWLRAVLPALAWPLALAAAAGFALCLSQSQFDALLPQPTLGGLLGRAILEHDVAAAPEALLLGAVALAPLLALGLIALLVRRIA